MCRKDYYGDTGSCPCLDGKQLAETFMNYNDNVQCAHSIEEAVQLAKGTIDDNVSDMILCLVHCLI
ncbi:MAG: hypothetical protein ACLR1A_01990 [Eubacterium ventriosum]